MSSVCPPFNCSGKRSTAPGMIRPFNTTGVCTGRGAGAASSLPSCSRTSGNVPTWKISGLLNRRGDEAEFVVARRASGAMVTSSVTSSAIGGLVCFCRLRNLSATCRSCLMVIPSRFATREDPAA